MKRNFIHIKYSLLSIITLGLLASSCTVYYPSQTDNGTYVRPNADYDYNSANNNVGYNGYQDQQVDEPTISFNNFYSELSPYGSWVNSPSYGQVWICNVPGFRPYSTNGYWVATDMGWSWASNYNWGWAPFHYGRWGYELSLGGWYWVPGYQWGPSWVTWSSNSSMYGWAPMAPGVNINIAIGSIPSAYWTFVPNRYMGYNNINSYYVDYRRNTTIINNVTIINNYNTFNRNRYNAGPVFRDVQRYSGRDVKPVTLVQSNSFRSGGQVQNGQMTVYNPGFRSRTNNSNTQSNNNANNGGFRSNNNNSQTQSSNNSNGGFRSNTNVNTTNSNNNQTQQATNNNGGFRSNTNVNTNNSQTQQSTNSNGGGFRSNTNANPANTNNNQSQSTNNNNGGFRSNRPSSSPATTQSNMSQPSGGFRSNLNTGNNSNQQQSIRSTPTTPSRTISQPQQQVRAQSTTPAKVENTRSSSSNQQRSKGFRTKK